MHLLPSAQPPYISSVKHTCRLPRNPLKSFVKHLHNWQRLAEAVLLGSVARLRNREREVIKGCGEQGSSKQRAMCASCDWHRRARGYPGSGPVALTACCYLVHLAYWFQHSWERGNVAAGTAAAAARWVARGEGRTMHTTLRGQQQGSSEGGSPLDNRVPTARFLGSALQLRRVTRYRMATKCFPIRYPYWHVVP